MRADLSYWVALTHESKIGPRAMTRLFSHFAGDMEAAWKADAKELVAAGLSDITASSLVLLRESFDIDKVMNELAANNITAITREDDVYPKLLKEIFDPPAVLYVAGTLPDHALPHLAVVGSRHATTYGIDAAKKFSGALAEKGVVIVSGLAFGVDEAAHTATLEAKGKTIAVLASGLLNIQTGRSRYLAHRIATEGGAVISEFAPHMPSLKPHFPIRNRVISGICKATLVVEAAMKSGSLITARCAMDQGRDVFAIPGSIFSPTSEGAHDLIRQGAGIAAQPQDIEDALNLRSDLMLATPRINIEPANPEEAKLLAHLSAAPIHADDLVRASGLSSPVALPVLTILTLKGHVRQLPGNYYIMA